MKTKEYIFIHKRLLIIWLMCCLSAILCFLFETNYPISIKVSLTLFSLVVILGIWKVKCSRYSLLTRTMLVLYSLPFVHCFGYLFDETYSWMALNPYQQEPEITKRMVMVGCIGASGLVAGYLFSSSNKFWVRTMLGKRYVGRTLRLPAYVLIALLAIMLVWLNAPSQTILTAAYGTDHTRVLSEANFNAGGKLAFVFAVMLLLDLFNESNIYTRKIKLGITLFVIFDIVIWLQFLRGERECIGLVFALAAVYIIEKYGVSNIQWFRKLMIVGVLLFVFLTAQLVGFVRSSYASTRSFNSVRSADVTIGTWSAVLLTPLSVVGDFYYGLMEPRWGETYFDYALSLPPGFVTSALGIKRPIEGDRSPAWEMRYGLGGTHAMVVPFMNFKSYGVFLVLLLYGFLIGRLERSIARNTTDKKKLLYATIFIIGPEWFWYGEMNFIRGIMAFVVVWGVYKFLVMPYSSTRLQQASLQPVLH